MSHQNNLDLNLEESQSRGSQVHQRDSLGDPEPHQVHGSLIYFKGLRSRSKFPSITSLKESRLMKRKSATKISGRITNLSSTASPTSFSTKTTRMPTKFHPFNSIRAITALEVIRSASKFSRLRALICNPVKKRNKGTRKLTKLCIASYLTRSYSAGTQALSSRTQKNFTEQKACKPSSTVLFCKIMLLR